MAALRAAEHVRGVAISVRACTASPLTVRESTHDEHWPRIAEAYAEPWEKRLYTALDDGLGAVHDDTLDWDSVRAPRDDLPHLPRRTARITTPPVSLVPDGGPTDVDAAYAKAALSKLAAERAFHRASKRVVEHG